MSHFYMFSPTNFNMKFYNGNIGHAKGTGVVLCRFPNCPFIYPVGPVYNIPVHPSNTISSVTLKFYVGFQKITSEPLEYCGFVFPQVHLCRSPYQTQNNLYYLHINIFRFKTQTNIYITAPTVCGISKQILSQLIHECSSCVLITRLYKMSRKVIRKGLPMNLPNF